MSEQKNEFTVLFDYDSMLYKAVHKVCSFSDVRKWFRQGKDREWMEKEIINLTINRLANMGDAIFADIEDAGINIQAIEYFMTACPKSTRKTAYPEYKANRAKRRNKWVPKIRKELLRMNFATVNEKWEADDLIKDRAIDLGVDNFVICSIDKDLKQIPGIHFDYYRPQLKGENGERVLDDFGFPKIAPCRGLDIVSVEKAKKFFWLQMLMGDSGDNIKGIPRVGKVKGGRMLEDVSDYKKTVLTAYQNHFGETEGKEQFDLHLLLVGLGINHREFN